MSFLATEVSVDRLSGLGPSQGLASGGLHKGFCPGVKPLSYIFPVFFSSLAFPSFFFPSLDAEKFYEDVLAALL